MLDRFVDVLFVALFFIVFLPLLAWYSILAELHLMSAHFKHKLASLVDFSKLQAAGEFNFSGAIEAYEGLIDSTLAKGRL